MRENILQKQNFQSLLITNAENAREKTSCTIKELNLENYLVKTFTFAYRNVSIKLG